MALSGYCLLAVAVYFASWTAAQDGYFSWNNGFHSTSSSMNVMNPIIGDQSLLYFYHSTLPTTTTTGNNETTTNRREEQDLVEEVAQRAADVAGSLIESERIYLHLRYVLDVVLPLGDQKAAKVFTGEQYLRRQQLVRHLSEYAERKMFPRNELLSHRRAPRFCELRILRPDVDWKEDIEECSRICAVGYLVQMSMGMEPIRKLFMKATQRNEALNEYRTIAEMLTEDPEGAGMFLRSWAKEHGLTIQEVATIQPQYQYMLRGTFPSIQKPEEFKRHDDMIEEEVRALRALQMSKALYTPPSTTQRAIDLLVETSLIFRGNTPLKLELMSLLLYGNSPEVKVEEEEEEEPRVIRAHSLGSHSANPASNALLVSMQLMSLHEDSPEDQEDVVLKLLSSLKTTTTSSVFVPSSPRLSEALMTIDYDDYYQSALGLPAYETYLHLAARLDRGAAIVEAILDLGLLSGREQDSEGRLALHSAVSMFQKIDVSHTGELSTHEGFRPPRTAKAVVRLLADKGTSGEIVNSRDYQGRTPLITFVLSLLKYSDSRLWRQHPVAKELLRFGADENLLLECCKKEEGWLTPKYKYCSSSNHPWFLCDPKTEL